MLAAEWGKMSGELWTDKKFSEDLLPDKIWRCGGLFRTCCVSLLPLQQAASAGAAAALPMQRSVAAHAHNARTLQSVVRVWISQGCATGMCG